MSYKIEIGMIDYNRAMVSLSPFIIYFCKKIVKSGHR